MTQTEHQDFEELAQFLPFYVNGTLDNVDKVRVEAGLAASAALRAMFAEEQSLKQRFKTEGKKMTDLSSDSEDRLGAVLDRLEEQKRPPRAATHSPTPVSKGLLTFLNPANWHPAVSLALAIAVAVEAGWIANQGTTNDQGYQTVSGPDGTPIVAGPVLIVRPSETAKWADVEALLATEELRIVAGPDDGRLTVRTDKPKTDLKALAIRLRADPAIAFVGEVR